MSTDTTPTPDERAMFQLPPLPPTKYYIGVEGDGYGSDDRVTSYPAWDDNQMRAYARASIAAALAQAPAEPEDEFYPLDVKQKAAWLDKISTDYPRDSFYLRQAATLLLSVEARRAALAHQSPAEPPQPLGQQVVHEAERSVASTGAADGERA